MPALVSEEGSAEVGLLVALGKSVGSTAWARGCRGDLFFLHSILFLMVTHRRRCLGSTLERPAVVVADVCVRACVECVCGCHPYIRIRIFVHCDLQMEIEDALRDRRG